MKSTASSPWPCRSSSLPIRRASDRFYPRLLWPVAGRFVSWTTERFSQLRQLSLEFALHHLRLHFDLLGLRPRPCRCAPGIQYLSHVVCALIAMRTIEHPHADARAIDRAPQSCSSIRCSSGTYHYDPLERHLQLRWRIRVEETSWASTPRFGIYFAFAASLCSGEKGLWMARQGLPDCCAALLAC